ncbi:hypothetical protein [Mucilaginibacter sp. BT774]|uniref:hypothetical protein n=1 Tax=Mucilaginibacter sp. BT774 TaxID=3062276 RepID=UPI002676BC57|nr:hypothetical protein [Mucilaginibacter sp. BT774]MDO3627453.1 hypothetical protein [Mucilaginibacter sp. BT774]
MLSKIFLTLLVISVFACNRIPAQSHLQTDTASNNYDKVLSDREKQASEKQNDSLGDFITRIDFKIKTDNLTDFEDGFIPWVELEHPDKDLKKLIDKGEKVIRDKKVTLIIDYPLSKECKFELTSSNGFTREALVKKISDKYHQIYQEEESTATVKTVPVKERTTLYNRNQTDGKYGIWGHDLADLALDHIMVYKSANGDILLSLDIDS